MISLTKAFRGLYRLCQCGCKYLIRIIDKFGNIRSFKFGHGNKGNRNGQYKIGRYFHRSSGYWYLTGIYDHYNSNKRGRIPEHIYNFTMYNKCCMLLWGVVHHKDENKENNMPWNLEGMMDINHRKLHKPLTDMSDRRCSDKECPHPETTAIRKNGTYNWYGNQKDGWICNICYQRWYDRNKRIKTIPLFRIKTHQLG